MLRHFTCILLILGIAGLIIGCGSGSKPGPGGTPSGAKDKITKALAQLSAEDQKAARKQKICPVSEEPLGSMGVPPKISVKGHDVFICCKACEKSLKGEPEKYLKKLGHAHHKHSDDKEKIATNLKKLSEKDQETAHKQKICPVTGKPLGSMGAPKKVSVKGHDVFVCCPGCVDTVKKDPDKYLKKLGHAGLKRRRLPGQHQSR